MVSTKTGDTKYYIFCHGTMFISQLKSDVKRNLGAAFLT